MVLRLIYRLIKNRCPRKEQYPLFDLFKTFDQIKSSHKSRQKLFNVEYQFLKVDTIGINRSLCRPDVQILLFKLYISDTEVSFSQINP